MDCVAEHGIRECVVVSIIHRKFECDHEIESLEQSDFLSEFNKHIKKSIVDTIVYVQVIFFS